MKLEIKNHICHENGQSGKNSLVPPNKHKAQLPRNYVSKSKFFCRSFLYLNRKKVQTLTKVSNKTEFIKKLRQKLSFFN